MISEIQTLQSGGAPPPDPDNIGSHNFTRSPVAVVFGSGIDSEDVEEIRQACGGTESKLAWVQGSAENKAKAKANPPDFKDSESLDSYAEKAASAAKKVLEDIREKDGFGVDGMYYY